MTKTTDVMVYNEGGKDNSLVKASTKVDGLVWAGISFRYERVGVQHTITVAEVDVRKALLAMDGYDTRL